MFLTTKSGSRNSPRSSCDVRPSVFSSALSQLPQQNCWQKEARNQRDFYIDVTSPWKHHGDGYKSLSNSAVELLPEVLNAQMVTNIGEIRNQTNPTWSGFVRLDQIKLIHHLILNDQLNALKWLAPLSISTPFEWHQFLLICLYSEPSTADALLFCLGCWQSVLEWQSAMEWQCEGGDTYLRHIKIWDETWTEMDEIKEIIAPERRQLFVV